MTSNYDEISRSDMTDQVARFLMECEDPVKRLNYVRRHWDNLGPEHELSQA